MHAKRPIPELYNIDLSEAEVMKRFLEEVGDDIREVVLDHLKKLLERQHNRAKHNQSGVN